MESVALSAHISEEFAEVPETANVYVEQTKGI